jgi:hypothetical protein
MLFLFSRGRRGAIICVFVAVLFVSVRSVAAQELPDGNEAALKQLPTFRVPSGMTVDLFAAEPQLASPVAIGLDESNRVFVAEEYRFNLGTEENRTRPFLLEDDLQLQTTDDRLRMYEKFADKFDGGMEWFRRVADQVRMVEDTDGDGRADRSFGWTRRGRHGHRRRRLLHLHPESLATARHRW